MRRLDPRLASPTLLALAAQRCLAQRTQPPPPADWRMTEGLSSLLAYAKTLPPREPWALDDLSDTGMGQLLREARLRQKAR
jgi:hypothetical protein